MPVDPTLRAQLEAMLREAALQAAAAPGGNPRAAGAAWAEAWFAERYGHRVACSEEEVADLRDSLASIPPAAALPAAEAERGARLQLLRDLELEPG
ncbi:hypothetical protein BKE38_18675 [Pseudoroseomonas deserti]|uniref:Uncharacterized protein n=1 Tax=Teichococcus deserti TaxID=1817963 RepID=A0A1V2H160_9PROT|nr:hypothetical protein [Pseudoroseomonas deserti]ONG50276.1 hypothetical protein BKE38_18675 [Pseudoroseomonas deserti]